MVHNISPEKIMVEITKDWRELHNGKYHNLYCSPNVGGIKLRKWEGHARKLEEHTKFWFVKLTEDLRTNNNKDKGKIVPVL
jgi:hypothetical protein